MDERRSVAGAEGLAAEALRKSTRRKSHPLTVDEKTKKARAHAERRNTASANFLAVEATRKSAHCKTNPMTVEQKAKKALANATCYRQSMLIVDHKAEKLEFIPKDGMRKVHKLQLFDNSITVTVMRLDQRRLPIPLLRMHQFQTRY